MAEMGRRCFSAQGRIAYNRLFRAMSRQLLSISKSVTSTACSVFGHPYEKKEFSFGSREFPFFFFAFFASGPVTGYHWEEPGSGFTPAIRYLYITPRKLLLFSLTPHGAPNLSSCERCSSYLVALRLIPALSPVPHLSGTGEPRTGHSALRVVQNMICFKAPSCLL